MPARSGKLLAAFAVLVVATSCGGGSTPADPPPPCRTAADCDDGQFCNGAETCDGAAGCKPGTPPSCDDSIACTTDTCDAGTDACAHATSNAACDDGAFCNGAETCNPGTGCVTGTPPSCDDSIACTIDTCDAGANACAHAASNAACDDGAFCNGAEICNPLTGCTAGAAPSCDDSIACTIDTCDAGANACAHAASSAACDDGRFCNGAETCDPGAGCVGGTPPSCDDAISCTVDACDTASDVCLHAPLASACDDGDFCDGGEVCDADVGCKQGSPPSCDDGVACTSDSCTSLTQSCDHMPVNAVCTDGLFCNGAELCDPSAGCVAGAPPSCEDGLSCTTDGCDDLAGRCTHAAVNAACDDGRACTGTETCSLSGPGPTGCIAGTYPPPQPPLLHLDPPRAFNGIATPLAIYLAGALDAVDSVTLVPAGGGAPIAIAASLDLAGRRIAATIPPGLAAGSYDVHVAESAGCDVSVPAAVQVISTLGFTLTSVSPAVVPSTEATRVAILAAMPGIAVGPVRAYLAPSLGGAAIALASPVQDDASHLRATVPAGLPAGDFDLVVVGVGGTAGVLSHGLSVIPDLPPRVDGLSPRFLVSQASMLTISGARFRNPTVSLWCESNLAASAYVSNPAMVVGADASSITVSYGGAFSGAAPGYCDVVVTNSDGSSAQVRDVPVVGVAGNFAGSFAGATLPDPRRAPAVAALTTPSGRWIVAAGGDTGAVSTAQATVFVSPAGPRGPTGWVSQRNALPEARTLAGAAGLGRYVYVVGGSDAGGSPRTTVLRAALVDPAEAPAFGDLDLQPGSVDAGLGAGVWTYRVSAIKGPSDSDDPDGETVASPPFVLELVDQPQKISATLTWSAVPGAVAYRIYRSATPGAPATSVAADVSAPSTTWTDAGAMTSMSAAPVEEGSLGRWRTLAALGTARESPAVLIAPDPSSPANAYLFALQGRAAGGALATYELLPLAIDGFGRQTPAGSWVAGASVATARYQHTATAADASAVAAISAGQTYVYVAGGTVNGTTAVSGVEVAAVSVGGQLGSFGTASSAAMPFGHGAALTGPGALVILGSATGSGTAGTQIRTSALGAGTPPILGNFNVAGVQLTTARYLPGVVQVGPAVVVIGGSPTGTSGGTSATEGFVW